jgi:type VI secretion system protein ImpM
MSVLALGIPTWFGKLPGTGDFAYRRIDRHFQNIWDDWLQEGLMQLRMQQADWVTPYLNAPIWFFSIGQGLISNKNWVGVMMPSVDSVGRYFPLTLVAHLPESTGPHGGDVHLEIAQWWSRCAQLASAALHHDMDAANFDALLQSSFVAPVHTGPLQAPLMQTFPMSGCSSWISDDGEQGVKAYTMTGLPRDEAFGILFGCDDDEEITQRQNL